MSLGTSPADPWKWKWSNGVGKSDLIIIWCISITNNVKSNKIINETAQTAIFIDFPFISCPKWTKTMQMQTLFSLLQKFLRGIQGSRDPGMPYESWCPAVSENMVFFYAIIFKPELLLLKVWSNLRNFFWQSGVVTNLNTCSILSFILPYSIRVEPIGMFLGWLNGRTWKGKL